MPDDDAQEPAPRPEPSELVRASPSLMENYVDGSLSIQELERRAQGAQRLKEAYSSIPWYAEAAKNDPDYWIVFYDSRVNS